MRKRIILVYFLALNKLMMVLDDEYLKVYLPFLLVYYVVAILPIAFLNQVSSLASFNDTQFSGIKLYKISMCLPVDIYLSVCLPFVSVCLTF